MKNSKRVLLIVFLVIMISCLILESSTHFFRRIVDDVVYDNYHHYLRCEELPDLITVEQTLAEHQDTVKRIENLSLGDVVIVVDSSSCPGKASIEIRYPSHSIRTQIEDILGSKTFYGIPITLLNN